MTVLFFFCHLRTSAARSGDLLDCRIKSGNDGIIFLLSSSDKRSSFRGSLDCRLKADNDEKKNKHEHDRKE